MAIQEVIKYEGDNDILIYKHPAEDFNTLSQLIVHESQEAVFFSDGQALDSFKAGRYTLETKNIPLISKLRNLVTGGVSPFHTEVYGKFTYLLYTQICLIYTTAKYSNPYSAVHYIIKIIIKSSDISQTLLTIIYHLKTNYLALEAITLS